MAKDGNAGPHGLAIVDKAAGWTSHDVVAKARGQLGTRKVGHSGTLDPDATGVLLLGVGKVTRLLRFLGYPEKRYTGVVVLGTATSTLDASGEVTGTWDMSAVGRRRRSASRREALTGEHPADPADGVRRADRREAPPRPGPAGHRGGAQARGRSPSTRSRSASAIAPGRYPIEVTCSSGTYIRSLAADLGSRPSAAGPT